MTSYKKKDTILYTMSLYICVINIEIAVHSTLSANITKVMREIMVPYIKCLYEHFGCTHAYHH